MVSINLQSLPQAVSEICEQYHVRRLCLFGSALRGELRPESDVDLLVEYESVFTPSFFKLVPLARNLSPFFDGRPIDLVLPDDLHWFIRDDILDSARPIYER
jgi:uncharacterized protein